MGLNHSRQPPQQTNYTTFVYRRAAFLNHWLKSRVTAQPMQACHHQLGSKVWQGERCRAFAMLRHHAAAMRHQITGLLDRASGFPYAYGGDHGGTTWLPMRHSGPSWWSPSPLLRGGVIAPGRRRRPSYTHPIASSIERPNQRAELPAVSDEGRSAPVSSTPSLGAGACLGAGTDVTGLSRGQATCSHSNLGAGLWPGSAVAM
jgi:hypothetical protein